MPHGNVARRVGSDELTHPEVGFYDDSWVLSILGGAYSAAWEGAWGILDGDGAGCLRQGEARVATEVTVSAMKAPSRPGTAGLALSSAGRGDTAQWCRGTEGLVTLATVGILVDSEPGWSKTEQLGLRKDERFPERL